MNMRPYYTIIDAKTIDPDSGFHGFMLEGDPTSYTAVEYYCTNPACSCEDVLLSIEEVDSEGRATAAGSVIIDMNSWNVEEVKVNHPRLNQSQLTREFRQGLPEIWKKLFREHRARVIETLPRAAAAGKSGTVTTELIRSNASVGYTEIFGEWPPGRDPLSFQYGDRTIVVDEQYCMNPACDCRQAILTFVELISVGTPVTKGVIAYPIGKSKYEVMSSDAPRRELEELARAFETARPLARNIVSQHYSAMKNEGKRLLQEERRRLNNEKTAAVAAPGRNDPCPCGSGKKFKKCCG